MSKVNLKAHPFHLSDSDVDWVLETISGMTIEEKIGQLFFPMGFTSKESKLKEIVSKYKIGGMMYRPSKFKKVVSSHRVLQTESKIPLFLAANLEAGGNGIIEEGTNYGSNMEVGATYDPEYASILGDVASKEGKMAGCNMAFAPVIDLNMNFRNPVTNTRAFSDRTDLVASMGAEYVKSAINNEVAVTIKHFPGDGVDGRDHHLVKTVNSLSINRWRETFGKAYEASIKVGARGLMVGHITLPDYFEENDELRDVPASLNPVLLNKLLREELGYNGLTMTDATLMTGFGAEGRRKDLVTGAIMAGCDMYLFNRNLEEEYNWMLEGYHEGKLTEERLNEALLRILGLKAALNLNKKTIDELVPQEIDQTLLDNNVKRAQELADKSITLVKDTQAFLPLTTNKYKKVGVIYFGNVPMAKSLFKTIPGFKGFVIRQLMKRNKEKTHSELLIESLNKNGFDAFAYEFGDITKIMKDNDKSLEEWKKQFDAIIILSKMEHASNQTSLQVTYKAIGFDAPWFVNEVPTMLLNIANPYQNYDFAMVETIVNTYTPNRRQYDLIVEKLMGKTAFKGVSPVELSYNEYIK